MFCLDTTAMRRTTGSFILAFNVHRSHGDPYIRLQKWRLFILRGTID